MKTPIKNLEEALVYLQRLMKGDIRESGISNLDKAVVLIQRAHDALLIEEFEK